MRKRRNNNTWVAIALIGILVSTLVLCVCLLAFTSKIETNQPTWDNVEDKNADEGTPVAYDTAEIKAKKIDFQPTIDEWANSVNGNKSVIVYDLDLDEAVGKYNETKEYSTASLYKLFVVYEGYRRIETGEWEADDPAGVTGYTVAECLDMAIRESYSPCAEALWYEIDPDELDEIIEHDYEITHSDISEMISTPEDIVKMMKKFYDHKDITDQAIVAQMKDSFLNQPTTEYNWRQGLPSGFTDKVNVYNKVGWDYNPMGGFWNIYHDAAIVEFPDENRHFIVVVMTNNVPFQQIRSLGTKIEEAFYSNV